MKYLGVVNESSNAEDSFKNVKKTIILGVIASTWAMKVSGEESCPFTLKFRYCHQWYFYY
jgi:hypothetical protein